MSGENNPYGITSTSIPEQFYAFDTKQPFSHCVECGVDLVNTGLPYFVEKAFRRYPNYTAHDVIYEFAMCIQCAEKMRNELSQESQQRMTEFMMDHINNPDRSKRLSTFDPESENQEWIKNCMVTDQDISQQEEYVIYGMFQGDKMMVADFPYALGADAMDEMTSLLSNETIDQMDDFMGKHFTGPPEVNEILGPRRPIFF